MLVLALESLEGCRLPRMAAAASLTTDFPVAIAAGSHPFPSRTRKLRLPAPMVLGGRPPGRVGRRRISQARTPLRGRSSRFTPRCGRRLEYLCRATVDHPPAPVVRRVLQGRPRAKRAVRARRPARVPPPPAPVPPAPTGPLRGDTTTTAIGVRRPAVIRAAVARPVATRAAVTRGRRRSKTA